MGGGPIGPLHGLPVTIKDLVAVAGMPTRSGTKTSSAQPAAADAPFVERLAAAGAVVVGKTTTSEFGWSGVSRSPLTGITHNPLAPWPERRRAAALEAALPWGRTTAAARALSSRTRVLSEAFQERPQLRRPFRGIHARRQMALTRCRSRRISMSRPASRSAASTAGAEDGGNSASVRDNASNTGALIRWSIGAGLEAGHGVAERQHGIGVECLRPGAREAADFRVARRRVGEALASTAPRCRSRAASVPATPPSARRSFRRNGHRSTRAAPTIPGAACPDRRRRGTPGRTPPPPGRA